MTASPHMPSRGSDYLDLLSALIYRASVVADPIIIDISGLLSLPPI